MGKPIKHWFENELSKIAELVETKQDSIVDWSKVKVDADRISRAAQQHGA